jgi:positive regulator of sigma E activity
MDGVIAHTGQVRAITAGRAQIAVATAACASCGQAGGCGIGRLAGKRRESLVAVPAAGLRVGQQVTLTLEAAQLTQAALLGYLLPTILMLVGAVLGEFVGEKVGAGETAAAPAAVLGLLARLRAPLTPRLTQEPRHV